MEKKIRRIVTGHDKDGKSVVLMDGEAPNVRVREGTGFVSTLLWASEETPADLSGNADGADRDIGIAPPQGGSIFRIVKFPPVSGGGQTSPAEETPGKRHAYMHRTKTLDYAIVLSGKITLMLDDADIALEAGDTVVQRGTDHAWVNTGSEPCLMGFVLIDAKEPPELT